MLVPYSGAFVCGCLDSVTSTTPGAVAEGRRQARRKGLLNVWGGRLEKASKVINELTVGTTAVPNLANRGKRAGKSIPLSQIVAPPVMDPVIGFTSVRVGAHSPSVLG